MLKPIPDNYPRVSASLTVKGGAAAIDFYTEVFGATQRGDAFRMPDGSIAHSELEIGDSLIMIADENPDFGNRAPQTVGGTPVTLMLYVADVDATVERALAHGAKQMTEISDEFYGDRVALVTDPFGHSWHVASHVEDVTDEQMAKRVSEMFAS